VPRRAAFGVLVVPYSVDLDGGVTYALFRHANERHGGWQALRGAPLRGETPLQAAQREAHRIAGVPPDAVYFTLDSRAAIELPDVCCHVAVHAFGVRVCEDEVCPAADELEHRWVRYEIADGLLAPTADRNALWELQRRLGRRVPCR
jgi:hypothetical protein